jgi:hypothetical protein
MRNWKWQEILSLSSIDLKVLVHFAGWSGLASVWFIVVLPMLAELLDRKLGFTALFSWPGIIALVLSIVFGSLLTLLANPWYFMLYEVVPRMTIAAIVTSVGLGLCGAILVSFVPTLDLGRSVQAGAMGGFVPGALGGVVWGILLSWEDLVEWVKDEELVYARRARSRT